MPNNFGTTITPDVVARDVLNAVGASLPVMDPFMTDYSSEAAYFDQEVKVLEPVRPTEQDREADGAYDAQDMQFIERDVKMEKWPHITVKLTQKERSSMSPDRYRLYIDEQANGLMDGFASYIFGIINNPANFALEHVCAVANVNRRQIGKLRLLLKNAANPQRGPFYSVLGAEAFDELTNDNDVRDGDLSEADISYPEGVVRGLKGIASIHEWESLPTANNLIGMLANKRALAIATRLPDEGDEMFSEIVGQGGIIRKLSLKNGFTLLYRLWKNWDNGDIKMTLTYMCGAKVLDGNALARLVHTATA